MIVKFRSLYLEKLYCGKLPKGKPHYNSEVVIQFKKTILRLEQAENTGQLKQIRSLHFEALKGNKKGSYSVRVNKQYRLEFEIENDIITFSEITLIEDLSNHYE